MRDLAEMKCVPCRGGSPPLSEIEIQELKVLVPNWEVALQGGVHQLVRTFRFNDFKEALAFTNKVGEIAEAEDHHPEILLTYGKATVSWWTIAMISSCQPGPTKFTKKPEGK